MYEITMNALGRNANAPHKNGCVYIVFIYKFILYSVRTLGWM